MLAYRCIAPPELHCAAASAGPDAWFDVHLHEHESAFVLVRQPAAVRLRVAWADFDVQLRVHAGTRERFVLLHWTGSRVPLRQQTLVALHAPALRMAIGVRQRRPFTVCVPHLTPHLSSLCTQW